MIRGIYTAASGMISTLMANDTLANNMANVSTTGFKKSQVTYESFPDMVIARTSNGYNSSKSPELGSISTGSQVYSTWTDFNQGALTETGNTFDLGIKGDGFFTVQDAETKQNYYTRAGNFRIDGSGYLTTEKGDYVMGKLGKINIQLDEGPFRIDNQGTITGKNRTIDTLAITRFADNESLLKVSAMRYEETGNSKKLPEPKNAREYPGYDIYQGQLERSNTNVIEEMVNSISGMRLYEALEKNIHMQNESLGKATNEVGRFK